MREKRILLKVMLMISALLLCLAPAMKVRAENWIEMYPDDGTENPECLIEYDIDNGKIRATISSNNGMMEWDGTSGSQSVASMFGGAMEFESITIGKNVTRIDNRAFYPLKKGFKTLIIDEDNTKFQLQDGMVVNKAGNSVYLVLNSYTDANEGVITLPDTITEIGNHAFDHNKNIKVVNAPKVTGIGNWAFDGSTITKFTCENLNYIGENSFQNCEKLEEIVMDTDDGVDLVDSSFIGCKKLKAFPYKTGDITMNAFSGCESLESFTIGSNVNKIESCGFKHCISLTEMTIPSSVTTIGNSAFDDCQNLKTVTFESATPPTVGEDVFTSCPSDMKIIVPAGAEEAYVEAFGLDYYDNIYETGVVKYGVFINGVQFTNQKTSIQCGEGTAVYDPDTETLTLNHVTVNESTIVKLFGSWLHGGSIYSKLDNLTIVVNGENHISADADGISTTSGSNVTIKGAGKLVLDTLATSDPQMASAYVGLGDDPTGVDGGDLIIDGPEIIASKELQANRNLIIQGGSKVTCGGRLRSNNNGDIKILDGADVTAKTIDMGLPADMFSQEVYQRDMHVVLDGGKLTLQGLERTYGDNTWTVNGIFFCPNIGEETDPRGYIEIKDGVLIVEKPVEAGKSFTDCPDDHILISDGFEDESDGTELTVEEFKQGAFSVSSHKFGPWEKLDDEYHQRTCSGNGKHAAHSEQAEHSWDDGVVTKEATFEEEGEKTFTCKYCHATKTEKIEKLSGPATPTPTATPSQEPTPSEEPTSSPSAVPTSEATPSTAPTDSPSPSTEPVATPTPDPTTQMGKDGTAVGEGASLEAAEKAITSMTTDDDPAGSVYNVLQAKAAKVTKNSIKVSWKKPAGAVKFVVYANKCGKGIKPVKITEVTGTNFTLKKLDGKALKKGTYYKFLIVSVDKDNKVISTSKVVHAATSGGKVGNVKKITTKAKKDKVSLKAKKSFKLKAKQVAKSKKMKVKKHRVLKYETTDPAVATVNAKGVIKAVAKGNCLVYVYSQDGVCKKIKVTVK